MHKSKHLNIYYILRLLFFIAISFANLEALSQELSTINESSKKKYTFKYFRSSNGGIRKAEILDNKGGLYSSFMILEIKYFADGVLVNDIIDKYSIKLNNSNSYEFELLNPKGKRKLEPVRHKWEIITNDGTFFEEDTLFLFSGNFCQGDNLSTFVEGTSEKNDISYQEYSKYSFNKKRNRIPPVANATSGSLWEGESSAFFWKIDGVDNGEIKKVEYYLDGKLIYTHWGKLPHNFKCINPNNKNLRDSYDVTFLIYDDNENKTELHPGKCEVLLNTAKDFSKEI